jgi:hypothetical protein
LTLVRFVSGWTWLALTAVGRGGFVVSVVLVVLVVLAVLGGSGAGGIVWSLLLLVFGQ